MAPGSLAQGEQAQRSHPSTPSSQRGGNERNDLGQVAAAPSGTVPFCELDSPDTLAIASNRNEYLDFAAFKISTLVDLHLLLPVSAWTRPGSYAPLSSYGRSVSSWSAGPGTQRKSIHTGIKALFDRSRSHRRRCGRFRRCIPI
jgi:hypothetical protein